MAIRAPVLPAETMKSASPFCTASSASHMLDAAAAAHRLARLVLHLHDDVGMDDARALGERADAARRCGVDARLVAEKQKAHVGMALERHGGARHDHGGALVSTHRVERYRARRCHDPLLACRWLTWPAAPGRAGSANRSSPRQTARP